MSEASLIISRCGYSTVMDIAAIKKRSILVPTPGQTEQEYLARHLMKSNFALCIDQRKFRLKNAMQLSQDFNYCVKEFTSDNNLSSAIDCFIHAVNYSIR